MLDINYNLAKEIETELVCFLEPYKEIYNEELFEFTVLRSYDRFEINGKYKNEYDNSKLDDFIMLGMIISSKYKQVQIGNIFLPQFMKHNGIGKKMISKIFGLSEKYGYELYIVDMVDSFYNKMINRGALPCDHYDAVKIVKETKLI